MCICDFAWKGHPRNDLYCVEQDVKPYTLTHYTYKLALQQVPSLKNKAIKRLKKLYL